MTVLITGGTKGVGLAIAAHLAQPGNRIVLNYLKDADAAESARSRLASLGASVQTIQGDVGTVEGCRKIVAQLPQNEPGPLHIVHGAALIYPTTLLEADLEKFTRAIHTNGLSLLYLIHEAQRYLSRGSSIVFISGQGARIAITNTYGALGVGKAAAEALIKYLVLELAPRGIRINAVAPGLVHTGSVAAMLGNEEAAARLVERASKTNPSGRLARDEDYASLVAYLLSPAADYIQGQVVHVSGGAS